MLPYYLSCALLLSQWGLAQQWQSFEGVKWSADSVYLVTRGTASKTPLIAEQFNVSDRCSTHVGIGIVEDDRCMIYHVTTLDKDRTSALVREPIESFCDLPDATYCSIWACSVDAAFVASLRAVLRSYSEKIIAFDYEFDDGDAQLYCSEFCVKALMQAGSFDFPIVEKPLESFYSAVLGRMSLRYWPVDFFQRDARFRKIYESYP